jgi:hypothetical protein
MVFNHDRLRGNGCLDQIREAEGFLTVPLSERWPVAEKLLLVRACVHCPDLNALTRYGLRFNCNRQPMSNEDTSLVPICQCIKAQVEISFPFLELRREILNVGMPSGCGWTALKSRIPWGA